MRFPELIDLLVWPGDHSPPTAGAQILIIEDDEDNLMVMSLALELFGATPLLAQDGASGLALALSALPTLILMDIGLPDVSGTELLQQLQQIPMVCQIPVIAVTAMALVHERERILSAGFASYLSKPYLLEELYAQISQQLMLGP